MADPAKKPLGFWGVVGAVITASLLVGAIYAIVGVTVLKKSWQESI